MADLFKINNTAIPTPISWDRKQNPIKTTYSGKATLDGTYHNSIVRWQNVITVRMPALTGAQISAIDTLLRSGNTISFTHPTPAGSQVTKVYFVSAINDKLKRISGAAQLWSGYSFTLTEE